MLTVTDNTPQQINAALFEQDQNVKNKLSTVSGVVSAVYGACEWIFNKLKDTLARVATTGSYNDLTDKPTIVDTVAQNVPNAVSSNAVYGALTNYKKNIDYSSRRLYSSTLGETITITEDSFISYIATTITNGTFGDLNINDKMASNFTRVGDVSVSFLECYVKTGDVITTPSLNIAYQRLQVFKLL